MLDCYKRRSTTSSTSVYFSTRVGVRVDAGGKIWAGRRGFARDAIIKKIREREEKRLLTNFQEDSINSTQISTEV